MGTAAAVAALAFTGAPAFTNDLAQLIPFHFETVRASLVRIRPSGAERSLPAGVVRFHPWRSTATMG